MVYRAGNLPTKIQAVDPSGKYRTVVGACPAADRADVRVAGFAPCHSPGVFVCPPSRTLSASTGEIHIGRHTAFRAERRPRPFNAFAARAPGARKTGCPGFRVGAGGG